MKLKHKVYNYMLKSKKFNEPLEVVAESYLNSVDSSRLSKRKIKDCIHDLVRSGNVKLQGHIIKNGTELKIGTYYKTKGGNGNIVVVGRDGLEEYFVPASKRELAPDKTQVKFYTESKSSDVAVVFEVMDFSKDFVYGTVANEDGVFVFLPDDERYRNKISMVQNEFAKKAEGKRCSAKMLISDKKEALCQISEDKQIFGPINNPIATIQSMLDEEGISSEFPEEVIREANDISASISKEEIARRVDFRDKLFMTIDPATCKDMDDAVCVERIFKNGVPVGYKHYSAIADVSHYVKEGSALDKESEKRGTSIYLAGGVIPMFPERLSNDICSLNPNVDRLVMVVTKYINNNGKIFDYDICEGVINSKHKFAYEEVSALHHNDPEMLEKYPEYKETVDMHYAFKKSMAKHAKARGSLEIQGYEPTVILNENKDKVIDFINENDVDSHKVIEYGAVGDNAIVPTFLNKLGIQSIFRTHLPPEEKKFEELVAKLAIFGVDADSNTDNKNCQLMLEQFKERPESKILNSLFVRSLKRASYSTEEDFGHSALSLNLYSHFTSPIRRRPDLIVHRLVKEALKICKKTIEENNIDTKDKTTKDLLKVVRHNMDRKSIKRFVGELARRKLEVQCGQLNRTELVADRLSQKAYELCATLLMQERIGETVKGYISKIEDQAVTMTIYDENDLEHSNIIDVKIPLTDLKRKSYFVDDNYCELSNRNGQVIFRLNQPIKVKITEADPNTRTILGSTELIKKLQPETKLPKVEDKGL